MKPAQFAILPVLFAALSACFFSSAPLIPEGEGAYLGTPGVNFCSDGECEVGQFEGDTYVVTETDGDSVETTEIRLQELPGIVDTPLYLAEVKLDEEDGDEEQYIYLVARPQPDGAAHLPTYDLAMPECGEATEEDLAPYGIVRIDRYSCLISDLDGLGRYIADHFADDIATEAFWHDADAAEEAEAEDTAQETDAAEPAEAPEDETEE